MVRNLICNRDRSTPMRVSLLPLLFLFASGCGHKTKRIDMVINDLAPSGLYVIIKDAAIADTGIIQFGDDRIAYASNKILSDWTDIRLYNRDRSIQFRPMLGTPDDNSLVFYKIIQDDNKLWIFVGNYTEYIAFIATPKHSLAGHTLSIP